MKQNTTDAQLTVQELRDMVSVGGEAFSRRVLHYATSERGTRSYWFKQRSRLISMNDMLGLPTVYFTHSAAYLQWPELAQLMCPDNLTKDTCRSHALRDNPAVADWFSLGFFTSMRLGSQTTGLDNGSTTAGLTSMDWHGFLMLLTKNGCWHQRGSSGRQAASYSLY